MLYPAELRAQSVKAGQLIGDASATRDLRLSRARGGKGHGFESRRVRRGCGVRRQRVRSLIVENSLPIRCSSKTCSGPVGAMSVKGSSWSRSESIVMRQRLN